MNPDIDQYKRKILSVLETEQKCISISAIAQKIGLNRHAVARHLDVLEVYGKVRKIEKGHAKKYMLVTNLPFSGLIDISSDLILIFNSHLQIQYMNNSATHYFNTPLSSIIGKKIENLQLSLISNRDVITALTYFSFERSEFFTVQDENGRWFEITILGFSLVQAQNQIAVICADISEKKHSEEELKIAQEKYAHAFYASPDGISMSDLETGEILEINPSFCNMLGYSWKELIGSTSKELNILVPEDCREKVIQNTRMRDFGKNNYDEQFRKKNGERLDVSLSSSIIRIRDRECLLTVIRDISERIKAEEKIRKSEGLYRLLAESIKDVVWIMDMSSRSFCYISPSVTPLLGWTPAELYEMQVEEIISPEMAEGFIQSCKSRAQYFLRTDKATHYYSDEVQILTKSGDMIWNHIISHYTINNETGAVEIIGIARDITEKKNIYLKLVESEARFRLISDNMKDVIWIFDIKTETFTYVSPSIVKLRGYQPEDIINHSFSVCVPPAVFQFCYKEFKQKILAFESGDDSVRYGRIEIVLLHRDGHPVNVEVSTSFVAGPDRKVIHIIGVSRELSGK